MFLRKGVRRSQYLRWLGLVTIPSDVYPQALLSHHSPGKGDNGVFRPFGSSPDAGCIPTLRVPELTGTGAGPEWGLRGTLGSSSVDHVTGVGSPPPKHLSRLQTGRRDVIPGFFLYQ